MSNFQEQDDDIYSLVVDAIFESLVSVSVDHFGERKTLNIFNHTVSVHHEAIEMFENDFSVGGIRRAAEKIHSVIHQRILSAGNEDDLEKLKLEIAESYPFLRMHLSKSTWLARIENFTIVRRGLSKLAGKVLLHRQTSSGTESYVSNQIVGNQIHTDSANDAWKNRHNLQSTSYRIPLVREQLEIRAKEIYALSKAMECIAEENGMEWIFLTGTCPPEMHPNPTIGRNNYDETELHNACKWLGDQWKKFRAGLSKNNISMSESTCFGLRTLEPHRDGCPHIHALVFIKKEYIPIVTAEFIKRFDNSQEFFCDGKAIKDKKAKFSTLVKKIDEVEQIKCRKGAWVVKNGRMSGTDGAASPSSYINKYITKHLSSKQGDTAVRVRSWLRVLGVRSYSKFGMSANLTLWKDLRRIKNNPLPSNEKKLMDEIFCHPLMSVSLIEMNKKQSCFKYIYEEKISQFGEKYMKKVGVRILKTNVLFTAIQ
ncbi:hypothetical protein DXV75_14510 [Alteromonas aestuariivivens]|uniref:Replication gene A protein-like domain-containing protein n=1 Tax=Alteromonas aestuariivivens TaxID=1938339 RepID=A0A3D8M4H0_9ALTE|nr:replication endonuclease [Alteromonas aestuariivivens]RDV24424.1 hypothetical protein DXV75_14510 [Alteromonas aestuariivivens]